MILLLLVCLAVGVGVAAFSANQRPPSSRSRSGPARSQDTQSELADRYQLRQTFFSSTEATFYRALQAALVEQFVVLAKVRVADVLKPQKNLNRSEWQRAFNKISAKHFDFVLCDKASLKIIAVVELHQSSRDRSDRSKPDDFLSQAVASAGLPRIRFTAATAYLPEVIQSTVAQALK